MVLRFRDEELRGETKVVFSNILFSYSPLLFWYFGKRSLLLCFVTLHWLDHDKQINVKRIQIQCDSIRSAFLPLFTGREFACFCFCFRSWQSSCIHLLYKKNCKISIRSPLPLSSPSTSWLKSSSWLSSYFSVLLSSSLRIVLHNHHHYRHPWIPHRSATTADIMSSRRDHRQHRRHFLPVKEFHSRLIISSSHCAAFFFSIQC